MFQASADAGERFRSDLEALTGPPPTPSEPLGLAVSGGPDSLALLLLAHTVWPGAVAAATVDHGLRPESGAEAGLVAGLCRQMDVAHDILPRPAGEILAGNLPQAARELRYRLLGDWAMRRGLRWIATAHQRDDLAEGLLMRLARGAGVAGLAAMPRHRPIGTAALVRPLLDWTRAELAAIVRAAAIVPVDDPSNRDPRFDRARARAALAAMPGIDPARLAAAARHLRDAEDALDWAARREWDRRSTVAEDAVALDPADLPHELRRRLTAFAIARIHVVAGRAEPWRGDGLDRFVGALAAGRTATIAGVQGRGGPVWRFAATAPRRSR